MNEDRGVRLKTLRERAGLPTRAAAELFRRQTGMMISNGRISLIERGLDWMEEYARWAELLPERREYGPAPICPDCGGPHYTTERCGGVPGSVVFVRPGQKVVRAGIKPDRRKRVRRSISLPVDVLEKVNRARVAAGKTWEEVALEWREFNERGNW